MLSEQTLRYLNSQHSKRQAAATQRQPSSTSPTGAAAGSSSNVSKPQVGQQIPIGVVKAIPLVHVI